MTYQQHTAPNGEHVAGDLPVGEPVAYDGFGAPLYAHQVPPEGTE